MAARFGRFVLACAGLLAQTPEPRIEVAQGVHYVGEAVPLTITVVAGNHRPEIKPPRIDGARMIAKDGEFRALGASAIGDHVLETNRYVYRYELVPTRAGTIRVGPFLIGSGARAVSTQPVGVRAVAPPLVGRPATWLGGVGPLNVALEARPASIRLGESVRLRVTLSGPGARGSVGDVDWRAITAPMQPARVRVEDVRSIDEPPMREASVAVRPLKAGDYMLAPVRVSYFDPDSRTYQTRASRGVTVRVRATEAFEGSRVEYGAGADSAPLRWAIAALGSALIGACYGLLRMVKRRRRRVGARREVLRLREQVDKAQDEGLSDAVSSALIGALHVISGRPRGELTPQEVRAVLMETAADPELAAEGTEILVLCDRKRFGMLASDADELRRRATALLGVLADRAPELERRRQRPPNGGSSGAA